MTPRSCFSGLGAGIERVGRLTLQPGKRKTRWYNGQCTVSKCKGGGTSSTEVVVLCPCPNTSSTREWFGRVAQSCGAALEHTRLIVASFASFTIDRDLAGDDTSWCCCCILLCMHTQCVCVHTAGGTRGRERSQRADRVVHV